MDPKFKLNRDYDNKAIYTSSFYAAPEDNLDTHKKLLDTLKAFTLNQHPDTPFSLQILLTNGEIYISPLGLLDLNELKEEEHRLRQKYGLNYNHDDIPLCVKFAPHTKEDQTQKKVIGTTQELFDNFNQQFDQIWDTVKNYLEQNLQILKQIEAELIADSYEDEKQMYAVYSKYSEAELKEKLFGLDLKKSELKDYCRFITDMNKENAIITSAADFLKNEIIKDNTFIDALNDNLLRNMFFWLLDNTFYESLYYVLEKYQSESPKLVKFVKHHKNTLIVNMRNDAYERVKKLAQAKENVDVLKLLREVFEPIFQQLIMKANELRGK